MPKKLSTPKNREAFLDALQCDELPRGSGFLNSYNGTVSGMNVEYGDVVGIRARDLPENQAKVKSTKSKP
ncbi:MAG: hypothetical protein HOI53_04025 [Francisellaceae bacterium]|jgi:hypothetical protein|nr:hypothetical protein [Francisellaceae bacterium]MBT6207171.1 hypothetical protein [Francisellaceae bacterium]MBT6538751.1 hypothetical protein [Francisellaceae bacterium]